MSPPPAEPVSIDVRLLPRSHRHLVIFRQFEALAPGEAFELVNDHDPLGLLHQFRQILPGLFTWDYRLQGPDEWRVLIGRTEVSAPANAHIHDDGCTCGSSSGGCG
ncbi:MAG: hypothetical protein B7Y12_04650 [Rhizobiales bacterium 24-66-13]|jgi:uncharacterized protein (DUF2249 family)|nr:MAG: hypothetical protein B7Y95_02815 [Rhizobiales bacterium 32-66-11]OYY88651.1 MAG: hypothetical protein B7Y61_01605 [Rhizobiales bacterium 35-66-30]OYZ82161.1 MAG: hypothetical protein B7Y12_04650 [Rhizobiales bacterium 24-66-13]OZB07861.1 MAG: hypothetical protein B7X67_08500 [Rhizobiales bacterium 39-66-18]